MDFTYDEEQQALREAVRGLVGKSYSDFENRRRTVADEPGFDEKLWTRLAEMGVLGLPFDEEYGGMGAGPVEVGIVAQEIGRVLAPEPFLTSVVLAGGVVAAAGTEEQKASLLEALGSGRERAGLRARRARHPLGQHGRGRDRVRLRRRLDAHRRQGAGAARRPRRPARGQRRAPGRRHRRCSWSPATPRGWTGPATPPTTAAAPPGSRFDGTPAAPLGAADRRVRAHRPGARRRPDRRLQRGDRRDAGRAVRRPRSTSRAASSSASRSTPSRR